MKKNQILFYLISFSLLSSSFIIYAQDRPFQLLLGVEQNIHTDKVEPTPSLHFHYAHSEFWRVGFSASLTNAKLKNKAFTALELSNHTQLCVRIYHPFYFFFGPELSYFQPFHPDEKTTPKTLKFYEPQALFSWRTGFLINPKQGGFLFDVNVRPWFAITNMSLWGLSVSTSIGYRL